MTTVNKKRSRRSGEGKYDNSEGRMKEEKLTQAFKEYIRSQNLIKSNERILAAISGGLDSVVMAHLLQAAGIHFGIAHCHFGLRNEADQEEMYVQELAEKLNRPIYIKHFDTETYARSKGISIQMAARELRYTWFESLRKEEKYHKIALAHHLNDQAETILLNLAKVTGIRGLSGMKASSGRLIRPLLFASREDLEAYARQHKIEWKEDKSNRSIKYERNFIRHRIIPLFKELNPGFISGIEASSSQLRFAETLFLERLDQYRKKLLEYRKDGIYISLRRVLQYPHPRELLFELLAPYKFRKDQLANAIKDPDSTGIREFTSGEWRLIRSRNLLILTPNSPAAGAFRLIGQNEKSISLGDNVLKIKHLKNVPEWPPKGDLYRVFLSEKELEYPLMLRNWKKGDYFYPFGMHKAHSDKVGKKKISDFLNDLKLNPMEKENILVLQSGQRIAWVVGYRIDHRFRVQEQGDSVIEFRWISAK